MENPYVNEDILESPSVNKGNDIPIKQIYAITNKFILKNQDDSIDLKAKFLDSVTPINDNLNIILDNSNPDSDISIQPEQKVNEDILVSPSLDNIPVKQIHLISNKSLLKNQDNLIDLKDKFPDPVQPIDSTSNIISENSNPGSDRCIQSEKKSNIQTFGPIPIDTECQRCNSKITTMIKRRSGCGLWTFVIILFFTCPLISCVPFFITKCHDIDHYCPQCNSKIGFFARI